MVGAARRWAAVAQLRPLVSTGRFLRATSETAGVGDG